MIWYDFGPIRTSGSIVSTLTLHSLTGTLKDPGSFGEVTKKRDNPVRLTETIDSLLPPPLLRWSRVLSLVSRWRGGGGPPP